MNDQEGPNKLWGRYVVAVREYRASRQCFLDALRRYESTGSPETDPVVRILRQAFADPETERDALEAAFFLPLSCRQALFHELVSAALRWDPNNGRNYAAVLLGELPGEWVRDRYRPFIDQLLAEDPKHLKTSLLELCEALDPELGIMLVKRALTSDDAYLQDIGAHFAKRFTDAAERTGAN
jgi:hypothetical protein